MTSGTGDWRDPGATRPTDRAPNLARHLSASNGVLRQPGLDKPPSSPPCERHASTATPVGRGRRRKGSAGSSIAGRRGGSARFPRRGDGRGSLRIGLTLEAMHLRLQFAFAARRNDRSIAIKRVSIGAMSEFRSTV